MHIILEPLLKLLIFLIIVVVALFYFVWMGYLSDYKHSKYDPKFLDGIKEALKRNRAVTIVWLTLHLTIIIAVMAFLVSLLWQGIIYQHG